MDFSYYKTLAQQLGPKELVRAMARRANRIAHRALSSPRQPWHGPRLCAALGQSSSAAEATVLQSGGTSAFCDATRRADIRAALALIPGAFERSSALAEAAATGTFDIFGTPVRFGEPGKKGSGVDWSLDPLSGHRFALAAADTMPLLAEKADPKYPWVMGRMDGAVALAHGYWLARTEVERLRWSERFLALTRDFLRENPVGLGIHWACPMEVALRAANLAQALRMFADAERVRGPFALEVASALLEHCEYVEDRLEDQGAVPNNHLVANWVGLLAVASLLPGLPGSAERAACAARGMEAALLEQVHPDGWSFEGSVPYHRLSVELFTLGFLCASAGGMTLAPPFAKRLRRMFRVSEAYCSSLGLAPQIGDNDSGRAFVFRDRSSLDHGYLAPLGAALFGAPELKRKEAEAPDEAAWLLGHEGVERFLELPARAPCRSISSLGAGIHLLRASGVTVAASAGLQGQRGIGGHSHNDKLAFELHLRGRPVIVDPGTGNYGRDPVLRNAFRSTASHSTLQVEDREQNSIDPERLFALPDSSGCERREFETGPLIDRLVAVHHGFEPLGHRDEGPCVERTLALHKQSRVLEIEDRVQGRGQHRLMFRLQLPDSEVRLRPILEDELRRAEQVKGAAALSPTVAELGPAGRSDAVVVFCESVAVSIEPSRYSSGYGQVQPSSCLLGQCQQALPAMVWALVIFA